MSDPHDIVPYVLIPLGDGRCKAVFTVPAELVDCLIAHPILCRGSSFPLAVERKNVLPAPFMAAAGIAETSSTSETSVLSTSYDSPNPYDVAEEIGKRLAIRMENADEMLLAAGQFFGGFGATTADSTTGVIGTAGSGTGGFVIGAFGSFVTSITKGSI